MLYVLQPSLYVDLSICGFNKDCLPSSSFVCLEHARETISMLAEKQMKLAILVFQKYRFFLYCHKGKK